MATEVYRHREIKNIGLRPYNPPPEMVSQQIRAAREKDSQGELGVFLLKPGYFSLDSKQPSSFQDTVEGLITAGNLDIIATSCVQLTTDKVHDLYPFIFGPGERPIPDFVLKLRADLESYMSDYVFSYLVFGPEAHRKLEIIKRALRNNLGYFKGSLNVKNAVHVAEREEIGRDLRILFFLDLAV